MNFPLLLIESTKVFDDLHLMKQQVNIINILLLVCHRPISIVLECNIHNDQAVLVQLLIFQCISSGEINDKLFHFESIPMDDFLESVLVNLYTSVVVNL